MLFVIILLLPLLGILSLLPWGWLLSSPPKPHQFAIFPLQGSLIWSLVGSDPNVVVDLTKYFGYINVFSEFISTLNLKVASEPLISSSKNIINIPFHISSYIILSTKSIITIPTDVVYFSAFSNHTFCYTIHTEPSLVDFFLYLIQVVCI